MNSNVLSVNTLSIRTADRHVQEDTLQIEFGSSEDSIRFFSPFPEDLLDYAVPTGVLAFDIEHSATTGMTVSMSCGDGCEAELALDDFITADNNWQSVAIPLSCFVDKGVNLREIYVPMALSAEDATEFKLSDIRFTRVETPVACPGS